jgi:hypothetical protein
MPMSKSPTNPLAFCALSLAALIALPCDVRAQTTPEQATARSVKLPTKTVRWLFTSADRNKDGPLTRAEAKGHLPLTYRDFEEIDRAKRGWIDFDQFMAYTNQRVAKDADDTVHVGDKF